MMILLPLSEFSFCSSCLNSPFFKLDFHVQIFVFLVSERRLVGGCESWDL